MESLASSTGLSPYAIDAFLGNVGGCIGEVSALLLLVGGIFLIATKIITWRIPVVYLGSFAVLSWIFGGIPYGRGMFGGEILLPLFTGGLMLGASSAADSSLSLSDTSAPSRKVYRLPLFS